MASPAEERGGSSRADLTSEKTSPISKHSRSSDNGTFTGAPNPPEDPNATDHGNEPTIKEKSTAELLLVMSSFWLGGFLAAVDITLIATLTSPISASFGSLGLISWLASAYFIANAALQSLSGKLTDIFGRRAGLIFSNLLFAAGNLICGLAIRSWVVIAGRVIAGCGGGGLTTIVTFVASDLIPLRKRALRQGYNNLCFGVGAGLGGIFGGWVNDVWGWRWAFLAQVPVTAASLILGQSSPSTPSLTPSIMFGGRGDLFRLLRHVL